MRRINFDRVKDFVNCKKALDESKQKAKVFGQKKK